MSVFIPANTSILRTSWAGSATGNYTIMCWVWLPNATPSTSGWRDMIIVEPNIYMQTYSDGITMDFGSANADHNGSLLAINTWYHVAQVVIPTSTTSRQHYGYINGKLNVNALDTTTFTAVTGFSVGNTYSVASTYALNGNIRDVRIWNRALNATDIVQEMNSAIPIHDQSLLVWSPLDDDLYMDRSRNGLNWTSVGSPVLQYGGPRSSYNGRGMNFLR